jgi:protein tyrosine phosphatase (PTP) superfamily phosphohydrolase (DUF442 family)
MDCRLKIALACAVILLSLSVAAPATAFRHKDWRARLEFEQVSPALYRGKQPKDSDFKHLAEAGIKTIVNLRLNSGVARNHSALARKYGMEHIHIPVGFFILPHKEIDRFVAITTDPRYQPVFVHCQGGQDRVGLFVMAYRIRAQHWDYQKAYDEMIAHDFRRWLVTLWKTARDMKTATSVAGAGVPTASARY